MNQILTFWMAGILCATTLPASSQIAMMGNIEGNVFSSQKPIESATVILLRSKDSSIIKNTVTDEKGLFVFHKIAAGKYLVSVRFVSFQSYYSKVFELSSSVQSYKVPGIILKSVTQQQLSQVTVNSKKTFIKQKIDRTVINVEAYPTNVGLTALEVLEKSPGVSVDKDGNVSLKGKQGVLILMDGKQLYLSGADLANMLKNMPSSNLDQIEIMTNPPAKYDASGNSGIINIKTKKSKIVGINGSLTIGGGMGINPKANESGNINYRTGKINLFGNYSYSWAKGIQDLDLVRNFTNATTGSLESVFKQETDMNSNYQTHNYKIGMDYYLNKKTTLGVVVNGYINPSNFQSTNTTNIYNAQYHLDSVTLSASNSRENWNNFGGNFNLRHLFDTLGTEITSDFDYIHYTLILTSYSTTPSIMQRVARQIMMKL